MRARRLMAPESRLYEISGRISLQFAISTVFDTTSIASVPLFSTFSVPPVTTLLNECEFNIRSSESRVKSSL